MDLIKSFRKPHPVYFSLNKCNNYQNVYATLNNSLLRQLEQKEEREIK